MTQKHYEWNIEASTQKLPELQEEIESALKAAGCPLRTVMQISVVVEEVFANIAMYAYKPETGRADVRMEISGEPAVVTIRFADRGIPYDPLARQDPDLSLPAEAREIGGLGVYMTKRLMDEVRYEYSEGQNLLTLKKHF